MIEYSTMTKLKIEITKKQKLFKYLSFISKNVLDMQYIMTHLKHCV